MSAFDAVLLIAFGGPERPEDIRPFLDNVLGGHPVSPERYEEVVHHYELIGGRSPLNERTVRQADCLRAHLAEVGPRLPVYVGMRSWRPYLADTLARMADDGVRRALGLILAPHRVAKSWESYTSIVAAGQAALGDRAPAIAYAGDWFDHPLFIETMTGCVRDALAVLGGDPSERAHLIFTAHSVPVTPADADRYVREYETTGNLIAAGIGDIPHEFAYQSRSGRPRDPWLEPDVNDAIRARAARGTTRIVLAPIGFVCDHVEVLYDLDVEARATAERAGVHLARARTADDHPTFVRLLGEVVRRSVVGA